MSVAHGQSQRLRRAGTFGPMVADRPHDALGGRTDDAGTWDRSVQTEVEVRQALAMEPIALATTPADIAYVEARFVRFEGLARGLHGERDWMGRELPRATYRTADGALWFARDWWRLFDDAGGAAAVRPLFERRLAAAAGRIGHAVDAASEWEAYVAGLYGACLREVTPENMV